uniref:Ig-like domain-containing protein n=1 Tax=Dicentrarchus labrax TaxID=13489 RepID=A0A8P4K9B4_DICLA
MDWALVLVLQVMFQPALSVLFTVETEQPVYNSEFGGDVVMGCKFQPKLSDPSDYLKVTWHWTGSNSIRDVYRMDNRSEDAFQHPDYRGRVRLLTEELTEGWAKLQISRLRINDSGTYKCSVWTDKGADYKTITLSVVAPYKAGTKRIEKTAEGDEVLLSCQSEGYPKSSVMWQDGQLRNIDPSTTVVSTPDQLFKVTSVIRVQSSDKNNYTCSFTKDGYSATFHIPDEMPIAPVQNNAPIVVLSIGVIMFVIMVVAVLMYRRQKGCTEENLGAFLKGHYSDFSFNTDSRHHWDNFNVEELPQRLQNNKGQPVNLQALLPEAGETLFLEASPGSGKTTVAHILISSWTEGPAHALAHILDLSALQLLFYVDCNKVKDDLFQEIKTQLSLTEKISTEDDLRTVFTRSSGVLLLLDGYREGNQFFDESLKRFLSERGGCRVLVTACPGHCLTLKDTVGTGRVLELQTQTAKY